MKIRIKYWGERSQFKIVEQIETPRQHDEATTKRDKVQYANATELVEVRLTQQYPYQIYFVNEHVEITQVDIHYEGKPM